MRIKRSGPGQPTKLTEDVAAIIERAVRAGLPISPACDLAGINRDSFFTWMERGEAEESGIYRAFSDRIKTARATAQLEALEIVRSGAIGWQGSAWYLERCHTRSYGRSSK